jgi:hypothetical protein
VVRGAAVVPLVDDENQVVLGQVFGDGLPIVEGAEEAVQDDHGVPLAVCFEIEVQNYELLIVTVFRSMAVHIFTFAPAKLSTQIKTVGWYSPTLSGQLSATNYA